MPRHYLDHASTSPLRPAARDAMVEWLDASAAGAVADPGRIHVEGMTARGALEQAREHVAALLGARPREVVFTATGTEAVNTAVWGATTRAEARGAAPGHVVTTARVVAPQTAVLTASVPVAVNTTSRGRAPTRAATDSRASSMATRVTRPSLWTRPGSAGWPRR